MTRRDAVIAERERAEFHRTLRNLESALRRRDSGQLTGRNDAASEATRRGAIGRLNVLILTSDAVAAMLDSDERLAARYSRAERRTWGLPA